MTNYEKRVANKEIPPLNGLDALFIQATVEGLIKGEDKFDNDLHDIILGLKDEIDYLYKDEPDTLAALKKLMDDFTTQLVDTFKEPLHPNTEKKVKEAEEYSDKFGHLPPGWQERLNELLHKHPAK